MMKYIAKRLLHFVLIVLGITGLTFLLIHSVSGDAVDILYDNATGASEAVKDATRNKLGLNDPQFIQYVRWLGHMVQGDFGVSYISGNRVSDTFMSKLPNTIYLTLTSIVFTVCISIPLGIIAATKQNTWADYLIRFLSFIGNALPGFFVSLLLILFFCVKLNWFLAVGGEGIKSIILPTLTLAFAMSAKYTRQIRTVVLEELGKDYVIGARARGVKETVIIYSSVLKCCMPAIVALFALSFGSLLGGTAIIESIFLWDGVGKLALDAIMMRDIPMIQAYVIWMSLIYAVVNVIADISYRVLDPRITRGKEGVL
ncbi:ABC transporter permease [Candidatus Galacturonibacter soehngenii]|uniref:ABC transporter permease n=1 Tax=Candidatus Galacturonatibacter soehngenii TaxID=2307010 RepID=A0A7V7UB67_9FIRM|nr:ABC transporter permease [Candidatus Galacturonibacter soehngenii]KAB1437460.1 ABC transporter permease [Candidatus Galacturonibacter soehngenii]MBA4688664.1 ABC transporter permease [Candidatus Galacturonibacter soehngenii]